MEGEYRRFIPGSVIHILQGEAAVCQLFVFLRTHWHIPFFFVILFFPFADVLNSWRMDRRVGERWRWKWEPLTHSRKENDTAGGGGGVESGWGQKEGKKFSNSFHFHVCKKCTHKVGFFLQMMEDW